MKEARERYNRRDAGMLKEKARMLKEKARNSKAARRGRRRKKVERDAGMSKETWE